MSIHYAATYEFRRQHTGNTAHSRALSVWSAVYFIYNSSITASLSFSSRNSYRLNLHYVIFSWKILKIWKCISENRGRAHPRSLFSLYIISFENSEFSDDDDFDFLDDDNGRLSLYLKALRGGELLIIEVQLKTPNQWCQIDDDDDPKISIAIVLCKGMFNSATSSSKLLNDESFRTKASMVSLICLFSNLTW